MPETVSPGKIREIKETQRLFDYVPCNVYRLGMIENMVVYSCPSIQYLLRILYFLPDEITLSVLNGCYFLFQIRDHGMHIPSTLLRERDIIVFNSFDGLEEKTILTIMLHEIAHCYLKHQGPKTNSGGKQREAEAREWADRMLALIM
ncbi:MAG: hypothetical protein JW807_15575 [Spirochaetes bacterium]|nr:hypothetical protein [Spirochaetota bacterium]